MVEPDLDWIVMKAIEKDRARRYEKASGLVLDLQRKLQNEPVPARPPSFGYKAGKFVRKYRRSVAAAVAVLLALLAGLVASTVLYLGKRDALASESVQRQKAERLAQSEAAARQEAEAITTFLTKVFQSPDPKRDGRTITVAESLDRAAEELETNLASQPVRRARLQAALGSTYHSLGLQRDAIPLLGKSRDYRLAALGPEHHETLDAMLNLAMSYQDDGRQDEALKLQEEVLPLFRKVLGPEDPHTLAAMGNLADLLDAAGRREEALDLREKVLKLRRKTLSPEHAHTLVAMRDLARSYTDAHRHEEALVLNLNPYAQFPF